jgi:hypothetical protein
VLVRCFAARAAEALGRLDSLANSRTLSRSVKHLDQVTIAHLPGHESVRGDLAVKCPGEVQVNRSLDTAVFPDHRETSMPPFRQARPDPGLSTDMMSTFALGQMQVRRSGYGAMQLADPSASRKIAS